MVMQTLREKVCPVCGKAFLTMNRTRKYCCTDCTRHAQAEKKHGPAPEAKACAICGQVFMPRHDTDRFCSEACRRRDTYLRRYIRRFAGYADDETAACLFDALLKMRRKDTCVVCGKAISSRLNLPLCSPECGQDFLRAVADGTALPDIDDVEDIPVSHHVCSGWLDANNRRHPCPDGRRTAQHRCSACWQRTRVAHDCNVTGETESVYDGYC